MALATVVRGTPVGREGKTEHKGRASWPLRAALVLTTSFVASSHMKIEGAPAVVIDVTLAAVDYTSISYVVEGSTDGGTTWFQLSTAAVVVTLANLLSGSAGKFSIIQPCQGHTELRIQMARAGGTAVGTVKIDARVAISA